MSTARAVLCVGILMVISGLAPISAEETGTPHLGAPLSQSDIDELSITIFPDGRNLPEGRGPVRVGRALYADKCATCHGEKGKEGPGPRLQGSDGFISIKDLTRILRIKDAPMLVDSTGAMWPYATTLFDYIRRAMPQDDPKSLTNNEVYALTAHILHLNGLVERNFVADKRSLVKVIMPGLARSVSVWEDVPGNNSENSLPHKED